MASEEVNIHLGEERVSIEAIFDLVNLAPDQVVLEVGFPTDFEDDVSNLKVTINGRPVEVREEKERLFYPESINVHEIKVNWALWEMTFPGRSETRLRVFLPRNRSTTWSQRWILSPQVIFWLQVPAGREALERPSSMFFMDPKALE